MIYSQTELAVVLGTVAISCLVTSLWLWRKGAK